MKVGLIQRIDWQAKTTSADECLQIFLTELMLMLHYILNTKQHILPQLFSLFQPVLLQCSCHAAEIISRSYEKVQSAWIQFQPFLGNAKD